MDLTINLENDIIKINNKSFQKMLFIYNAIEEGWKVKKMNNKFIFSKKHNGKKEVFLEDSYLSNFIKNNLDITKI